MLIVLFIIFTVSYGFLSRIDGVGKVNFNKYLRNYHNSKNKILATKKKTNFFGEPHFEYSYYYLKFICFFLYNANRSDLIDCKQSSDTFAVNASNAIICSASLITLLKQKSDRQIIINK